MNLWLDQLVAENIVSRSAASSPLETGGLLIGYMTAEGPVVTALIGPGSGAIATPTSLLPDARTQQLELNAIYSQTHGRDTYLGDWHSHPRGVPNMSWRDRRTLAAIARDPRARLSRPAMLIAASTGDGWSFGAFLAERRVFSVSFKRVAVRFFGASAVLTH